MHKAYYCDGTSFIGNYRIQFLRHEQSLKNVGLYLPTPVFSHGQLYVVVSRVTSREELNILITDITSIFSILTMSHQFFSILLLLNIIQLKRPVRRTGQKFNT